MYAEWKQVTFTKEQFVKYINDVIVLVVEDDTKNVVGSCKILVEPKLMYAKSVCHVEDVVVLESCRGKGVGTFMLKQLIQWCEQKKWGDVYKLRLGCLDALQPFYEQCGLQRSGCDMVRRFT